MTEPAANRPLSRLAVVAFCAGIALTAALLGIKVVVAGIAGHEDNLGIASMLGMVLVTGVVFDTATVILAHLAVRSTADDVRRGRGLAGAGLALGYLHLVFWAFRIIGALVTVGAVDGFFERNFWLA